ncbi:hypothetical protein [Novosphingobium sp.]
MTLFSKDLVRSLVLGFALGSVAMVFTFGVPQAQAATPAATMQVPR